MQLSYVMRNASTEIRAAESVLAAQIARLTEAGVWNGEDADRFRAEWESEVSGPLRAAARTVDAVDLMVL